MFKNRVPSRNTFFYKVIKGKKYICFMCENKYLKIRYIIEKYFFRVVFTFALQIQEKWQTNSSTPQVIQKNRII